MSKSREPLVKTTILVPRRVWVALRDLAELKAIQAGGRASSSAVIARLVDAELARTSRQKTLDA